MTKEQATIEISKDFARHWDEIITQIEKHCQINAQATATFGTIIVLAGIFDALKTQDGFLATIENHRDIIIDTFIKMQNGEISYEKV